MKKYENQKENKIKGAKTYPVFAFANLEDAELLTACAQHHQTTNFVVNS